jgi:hypothetical protein
MRAHLAIALTVSLGAALFAADASAATAQQGTMKSCAASWGTKSAGDKAKTTYKDYMSVCMKGDTNAAPGKTVAAPPAPMAMKAAAAKPAPAMKAAAPAASGSAKCKDGKTVTYKSRSGTCSGHGGVATWL